MAKTSTSKPAATPAAGSAPKAPRPMTPSQRAERAEEAERDRLRSMTAPIDSGLAKLAGRIGQQLGDLEFHLGPAGPRSTTVPGTAPMAPRAAPAAASAAPASRPSLFARMWGRPGQVRRAVASSLVLLSVALLGYWLVASGVVINLPSPPQQQIGQKADQLPAKQADRLPTEEQKSSVEPSLPPPAEEQVVQKEVVDEQLLVDVKIRCEGLVEYIPTDKMSEEELRQLMNWCEAARQTPPQQVAEQEPAVEEQPVQELAGMYQSQQYASPPQQQYMQPGRQRQGTPRCPAGSVFRPEFGKCVGTTLHDIPINSGQRAYLASCVEIETRLVQRGNRLVQQQRCKRP